MKNSDRYLLVLIASFNKEDGLLHYPADLKPAAAAKLTATWLEKGLVREIRSKANMPVWHADAEGRTLSLKITKAGLNEIKRIEKEESEKAVARGKAETMTTDTSVPSKSCLKPGPATESVECLPPAAEPSSPPLAVPQTKRALVIGLLSRDEGASIVNLIQATKWLPHTTRAALSSLRRSGYDITRLRDDAGVTRYRIVDASTRNEIVNETTAATRGQAA